MTAQSDAMRVISLQGQITNLGGKPPGDAAGLLALSRHLKRLADDVEECSARVPAAAGKAVFQCAAGARFRLNATHVGQAGRNAANDLRTAAASAAHDAEVVQKAQDDWAHTLSSLTSSLADAKTAAAASSKAAGPFPALIF